MKLLNPKELSSHIDEDLLKLVTIEEILSAYLINIKVISDYERFFSFFIPDSLEYIVFVSPDISPQTIKISLIKAKEPLQVSCYVSSKLPPKTIIIIAMKNVKKAEEEAVEQKLAEK
ncbi:MAG: DUF4898 domain-containing protein [Saccharolobus sp.]